MMVEVQPIEKGIYIFNGRKASPLFLLNFVTKKHFRAKLYRDLETNYYLRTAKDDTK